MTRRQLKTPQLTLEFVRLAGAWRMRKQLAAAMEPFLPDLMNRCGKVPPGHYVITVALTDDTQQKALNRQFRGINKATNVLSFPQFTPRALTRIKPGSEPVYLGDISLSYQYIVRESKKNHKILRHHMIHLILHGILHILGYNHTTGRQAAVMENLERVILATMKIPDPYALPAVAQTRVRPPSSQNHSR
ncbi:MAG: rRNA maturation RNase YbeY [Alphaproteobacteria bacterium]